MEDKCADLKRVSTMTQEVHRDVKSSNCLSAEFENIQASLQHMEDGSSNNLQYKKLKGRAKTRWNSLTDLLVRHLEVTESLRKLIAANSGRNIGDKTTSLEFIKSVKSHVNYLQHVKCVSESLQKKHATLDDCQFQCDVIAELAKDGYGTRGHDFQHCK
jgi:hypothetical protein